MTAQRHRSAAVRLRSLHARATSGQVDLAQSPCWGSEIWPALAREHERRANRIDLVLARTAEIEAIIDSSLPT